MRRGRAATSFASARPDCPGSRSGAPGAVWPSWKAISVSREGRGQGEGRRVRACHGVHEELVDDVWDGIPGRLIDLSRVEEAVQEVLRLVR